MIDLFKVKLNGEYDDIGAAPRISNGLFLCDTDGDFYKRGFSYQITDGNADRIDAVNDYKIKKAVYPVIQSVCEWLNNWLIHPPRMYHAFKEIPQTGDLVRAENCGSIFVSYTENNEGVITLDNPLFNAETEYKYAVMHTPQDFEATISKMIYYDFYTREAADGLKSESIGNYSYTKADTVIGSLAYPAELVSGLEQYKKLRFIQ